MKGFIEVGNLKLFIFKLTLPDGKEIVYTCYRENSEQAIEMVKKELRDNQEWRDLYGDRLKSSKIESIAGVKSER